MHIVALPAMRKGQGFANGGFVRTADMRSFDVMTFISMPTKTGRPNKGRPVILVMV